MNDWMIGDSDDCVSIVAEPSNVSASGRIHVGVGFHQTSPPPTPEPRAGAPAPPPPANQLPHHSPPEYPLAASAVEFDRQMVKPTKHKPVKRVTFKVQNVKAPLICTVSFWVCKPVFAALLEVSKINISSKSRLFWTFGNKLKAEKTQTSRKKLNSRA